MHCHHVIAANYGKQWQQQLVRHCGRMQCCCLQRGKPTKAAS
jgi:hypothetical protein